MDGALCSIYMAEVCHEDVYIKVAWGEHGQEWRVERSRKTKCIVSKSIIEFDRRYLLFPVITVAFLPQHFHTRLDKVEESPVERRPEGLDVLVEVDGLLGPLSDTLGGEVEFLRNALVKVKQCRIQGLTYGVHLLVWSRGTKPVKTKLLVAVLLPSESGHGLKRHGGNAVWDDAEPVVLVLDVEDLDARHRNDTASEVVLLLEDLDGLEGDGHLGTGGHDGHVGVLGIESDVTTLGGRLDGAALDLRQILAGESEDGRSRLGGERDVVGGTGLVTVGRTPHHAVGEGTEVSKSLDRLVGRSILTETDGVVGRDVDDAVVGEGRQADGTSGVGNEVQESTTGRDDGTVGGHTVHGSSHGVLTHTEAHVAASVVTDAEVGGLEVNSLLPASVVGTSQVGGTRHELWDGTVDGLKDGLGQLSRRNSLVGSLVGGQLLLPALGELASQTTLEVMVEVLVLLAVLLEELVPLDLSSGTVGSSLAVEVVDLLGNVKGLLGVEAKLGLDGLAVILLQGVTVDTASTLELGAEADGGGELDDGWLVLDSLALLDGSLHTLEV